MENKKKVTLLIDQAKEVRKELLEMIHTAKSGHPGGSLSAADIMTVLYFDELNIDPANPRWDERDRFILSKGHVCPILYTCLGLKGYFDVKEFQTLRKEGSILQGHPDMKKCPGVDISSGSLGQGLSVGVGMALRAKRDGLNYRVFVLIGDGESQEGQIWEATQTAVKYKLDNLVFFVDKNGLQNDAECEVVMPTGDLVKKFGAFGCASYEIDGHSIQQILDVLDEIRAAKDGKPKCIVANTVKGKGVSFMENVCAWHGMAPNDEQCVCAIKEIEEGI